MSETIAENIILIFFLLGSSFGLLFMSQQFASAIYEHASWVLFGITCVLVTNSIAVLWHDRLKVKN